MQTHGGTAAADAIAAPERYFRDKLLVDWDGDGSWDHPLSDMSEYLVNTSRDQAITSTAPEELLLAEGYAAASLTLSVAGTYNDVPLAHHFAPYNGRSAFYAQGLQLGVDMVYTISVWTVNGWVDYPQFTGVVRSVETDRASSGVQIECLDNVEKLRTPVDVAAWSMLQKHLQDGYKRGQLADSTSLIDLAARTGGFSAGPEGMSTGTLGGTAYKCLSVPFHGSIIPEVGTVDNDQGIHKVELWEQASQDANHRNRSEAYFPGPHGYLARQAVPVGETGNYHKFWIDELGDDIAGTPSRAFILSGWYYWPNDGTSSTAISMLIRSHRFELYLVSNGACRARFFKNTSYNHDQWDDVNNRPVGTWETIEGPYSPLPSAAGWYHYTVKFQWTFGSGDIYMQALLDGQGAPQTLVTNRAINVNNDRFSGLVTLRNTWSVSDVEIWSSYKTLNDLDQYTYDVTPKGTAVFPSLWGRNRLTHTLRESNTEAWDLAKEVASAEYGAVYFDEEGRFHFETYDEIRAQQANVVRQFNVDQLSQLAFRYATDAIRNVWSVTTKAGRVITGIAYDLSQDGVPYVEDANGQLIPAVFVVDSTVLGEFFFYPDTNVMCVDPWNIPNIEARDEFGNTIDAPGYWDDHVPTHGRQTYTGTDFRHNTIDPTEQKFTSRDLVRFTVDNDWAGLVGYVNPDGSARFRISGSIVVEDAEKNWVVRNDDSATRYGERVIELKDNRWLQDEFQTRLMLANLIERTSKTIPVTDDVEVPGDPRIQLGDTIEVVDPDGMGESIKLQILGIKREFSPDGGLRDTYQVEVVEPAREWILGSDSYSLLGQSTILG